MASVCTDGSLLHGKWGKETAAVGWAFVALDVQGTVVAAAYGVPPSWVDTIQGAELWAVQMVLASIALPEKIYTDCKTVQMGVNASAAWAGCSKRRYARIWTVLHVGLDHGEEARRVVWMPAHTARSRIGEAKCGDGSVVDEHMWAANQLADLLAKKGAGMVAHSPGLIRDLAGRAKLTRQVAIYVGQLTFEANQHEAPDGSRCADAQKLEACVARSKALKKQLGIEKEASRAAVGAKPGGTKAARLGRRVKSSEDIEPKLLERNCLGVAGSVRRSAVDLRSGSESMRQSEAFVAGHEARVESAKLRAASESSGSRPSATDRLRLLRDRVAAKQAAGLACTSEGSSGGRRTL